MASGSNAPFSGEYNDLENIPTLPEGVTPSEATEKLSIDGKTIVENENGNIENRKSVKIVGDFENNDSGAWTGTDRNGIQDGESFNGQYSAEIGANDGNENFWERTLNFDGFTEFRFYVYRSNSYSSSDGEAKVIIGGNTVYADSVSNSEKWTEVIVDVSSISGDKTVKLAANSFGNIYYVSYDFLRLVSPSEVTSKSSNKAGGTV